MEELSTIILQSVRYKQCIPFGCSVHHLNIYTHSHPETSALQTISHHGSQQSKEILCILFHFNRRLSLKGKDSCKQKKEDLEMGLSDSLEKLYPELLSKPRMQVDFLINKKAIVINKLKKRLERIK